MVAACHQCKYNFLTILKTLFEAEWNSPVFLKTVLLHFFAVIAILGLQVAAVNF